MTTNKRAFGLGAPLALLLGWSMVAPRAAHAIGEQNGRIEGTISEAQTGAPVPGAEISVRSKSLIGGPQKVTSGEDGRYEFVALPPGSYDVEISYAGVKPIKRRVVIRQGETTPLDVAWSAEMAQAEVTVVQEERHMTKPDSTQTGTVLSADTESKIATGRNYQGIALQVAGVNDVNGGGNPQVKGANAFSNHYLVDGLDITDPVTNTFSANINFDSIASEEILTGGMEAQYNSMGGIINLITQAGSDEFHIDSSFYVNNSSFSAGAQYGSQLYLRIRPFSNQPRPVTESYAANLNLGGALVKHRLWFNASLEYDYRKSEIPIGPPLNVQHPARIFQSVYARLKLTWAPSDRHRISLSASADPATIKNVDQTNSELPVAENYQGQGGVFGILQWDYFKSQNVNSQVQAGFQYNHIDFGPQGLLSSVDFGAEKMGDFSAMNRTYNPMQPIHNNNDDGTSWYQGNAAQYDRRYTVQFDPSLSFRGHAGGYHDAKIGIQSRYIYHTDTVQTPGGSVFQDSGGGPLEAGLCDQTTGNGCNQRIDTPDYTTHQTGYGAGLYLQDRWKPTKRLTILPGIRFDYGHTTNTLGQVVSDLFAVGPRLGFTIDLTGDQKTIFTGFYGRANETLSLLATANADVVGLSTTTLWDPATKSFKGPPFPGAFTSGGTGGYRIDPNAGAPHTDELMAEIRREFFHDSIGAINYTYKKISNIWDGVEINQIWNPAGNQVVGYKNGQPQQIFKYTTPDANYRIYQGIDFTLESRPTPNWDVYGAYTLSWLYGPGAEELGQVGGSEAGNSAFYNARQKAFYDGFLPEDVRHQLKFHASYVYKGLNLGTNVTYQTGAPITHQYFNTTDGTYTNKRSPQGTDPGAKPNDSTQIAEFRTPDFLVVNARLSFDFHDLIKQHLIVIADLFNLFNLDTANTVERNDVPTFGYANKGRQQPFRFQLGLRYVY